MGCERLTYQIFSIFKDTPLKKRVSAKKKRLGEYQYVYNHTDHLGNIRVSYSKVNGQIKVLEENNYYPFGLKHSSYNQTKNKLSRKVTNDQKQITPTVENSYKYKYNGKELQEELGLNWYDYGARNYTADVPHFTTIDPLAEKYYNLSPYVYVANNPVYYIDPDGKQIIINYKDKDGNDQEHIYEYGGTYDGDNQFIQDVYASLNYIIDNDADTTGLIGKLAGTEFGDVSVLQNTKENNPFFGEEGKETYFNSENNSVIWDPEIGVSQERNSITSWIMGDGYKHNALVSPAEGLLHELGHAESSLENPDQHKKDSKYPIQGGYDNKEEFDVITKIENPASKKLKRDRTRSAHRGKPYKTVSPTSVKPKE